MLAFVGLMTSLFATVSVSAADRSVTYFVAEELPVGSTIGNVVADFALERRYSASTLATVYFEVLTAKPPGCARYLRLDNESWNIVIAERMDRERLCPNDLRCVLSYTLALRPLDLFQLFNLKVEVLDINDHVPTFSDQLVPRHVLETADIGTQLVVATVLDLDLGANGLDRYETTTDCAGFDPRPLTRRLSSGAVELRLRLRQQLDRETQARCSVVIWATDGGSPANSGSTRVEIIVDDANDNPPVFDADSYEVWIPEDVAVGTCFLGVTASDRDDGINAMITYSLETHGWGEPERKSPFQINSDSGLICLQDNVDFEQQSVYLLPVLATDGGAESLSGRSAVTVYVQDVNDNAPSIVVQVSVRQRLVFSPIKNTNLHKFFLK